MLFPRTDFRVKCFAMSSHPSVIISPMLLPRVDFINNDNKEVKMSQTVTLTQTNLSMQTASAGPEDDDPKSSRSLFCFFPCGQDKKNQRKNNHEQSSCFGFKRR